MALTTVLRTNVLHCDYYLTFDTQTRHGSLQISVLHLPLEWFTARSEVRYWLRIAISAYPTCIRRPR